MSKRAEELGYEALPPRWRKSKDGSTMIDSRLPVRKFYIRAYEQAEKDLALTWEDIAEIDALILDTNNEFAVDYSKEISRQQFYEEVLRKYNKRKK